MPTLELHQAPPPQGEVAGESGRRGPRTHARHPAEQPPQSAEFILGPASGRTRGLTAPPEGEHPEVELSDAPAHDGPIALLRAPGDAPFPALHAAAERAAAVLITFPAFRDGRGFTLAARLRERGYRGRIEAAGPLLPDQARHLARCGFDAVRLPEDAVVADWERMLGALSAAYQPAEDGVTPAWTLRAKAS